MDDTPDTLGFLTDALDRAGFTVLVAIDGAAALDLVDLVTPDLVLMDALMPGMSGFEVCRSLKRDKLLPHMPVIFMTGLSETEHVVEGLACGGVDYVTKPIVLEELLARIRVHLANARLAQDTHATLDASGRFLFATNHGGRVLWCTPKARKLLGDAATNMPQEAIERLARLRRGDGKLGHGSRVALGALALECTFLSPLGADEFLFRIAETRSADADEDRAVLQRTYSLTSREAEVLLWISRGKSNRDVGVILDISPRTVNKHLEQVFVKLGVQNRSAATGVVVRMLAR